MDTMKIESNILKWAISSILKKVINEKLESTCYDIYLHNFSLENDGKFMTINTDVALKVPTEGIPHLLEQLKLL